MYIEIRPGFRKIMAVVDSANPFLVVISIIGMFLDYTSYSYYVYLPNQVISLLFVLDFLIRFVSHNPIKYFNKGYGWVDFIASLPGFMFFLGNTPLLNVFKFLRIGKFFKIIRILRFLRIFNFLKRMKNDSPWVQDRIMQVGVVIVLIFVTGIVFVDRSIETYLMNNRVEELTRGYRVSSGNLGNLLQQYDGIEFYTLGDKFFRSDRSIVEPIELELYNLVEVELDIKTAVFYNQDLLLSFQNSVMIMMLSTLLIILVVMILYMGYNFAKDVQIIQLVIDSLEASDNLLLKQESQIYEDDNGELIINQHDSELINLLKVATNSLPDTAIDENFLLGDESVELSDLLHKIDELDSHLDDHNIEIVKETIKRVLPGVLTYIDKHYK